MSQIINRDRSIIVDCAIEFDQLERLVRETARCEKVGGYKVGISLLDVGLKAVADLIHEHAPDKTIIYDHQKAGTDIPERIPDKFFDMLERSGINNVILFPQAGPVTEYEWIKTGQDRKFGVIIGGEMTHPRYLESDFSEGKGKNYTKIFEELGINWSLGGYIRKSGPNDIYELAARMGVIDFVVPGNKPDRIIRYKQLIEQCDVLDPVFYSPGLITQGGDISEGAKAAGDRFHAIIGDAIYNSIDVAKTLDELSSKI